MFQIKWICPTAPTRPVALFGGFPCTACKAHWFKIPYCSLENTIALWPFSFGYKIWLLYIWSRTI